LPRPPSWPATVSLTSLVAHELAHSWSGNLVTNATWNDFWLNEGFTVYFENRIMEAIYGKDFADMQRILGQESLKETIANWEIPAPTRT
jgi:aminopeptidase N